MAPGLHRRGSFPHASDRDVRRVGEPTPSSAVRMEMEDQRDPVTPRSRDTPSAGGSGRGTALGLSCTADAAVTAPNRLRRALPTATRPHHRPRPHAVPAPGVSSIGEWSRLMISLAKMKAAKWFWLISS